MSEPPEPSGDARERDGRTTRRAYNRYSWERLERLSVVGAE